jgi:hypothetical protein
MILWREERGWTWSLIFGFFVLRLAKNFRYFENHDIRYSAIIIGWIPLSINEGDVIPCKFLYKKDFEAKQETL